MALIRDRHNIIIQHVYTDPTNEAYYDGGDSISRTGIMALCGSKLDSTIMEMDYRTTNGEIVRHPYDKDPRWKDYKETSRDQLVCAVVGMNKEAAEKVRKRHNLMFINKDFLAPDVMLHLALCADHWSKHLWGIIGYPWLMLSIFWSTKIKPDHELNQIFCQCVIAGPKYLQKLINMHPNWRINLEDYWGKYPNTSHGYWRAQPEIAEAMIKFAERFLK
jgi:hypothetical protein